MVGGTSRSACVHSGITNDEGKFLNWPACRTTASGGFPTISTGHVRRPRRTCCGKVLSQQPDQSVAIAQVGFSTNLAQLLALAARRYLSARAALELVRQKVPSAVDHGRPLSAATPMRERFLEYNVKMDIAACQQLMQDWPTPIVLSGFEIGIAVPYPAVSIERDYGYVPHHPLAEALLAVRATAPQPAHVGS